MVSLAAETPACIISARRKTVQSDMQWLCNCEGWGDVQYRPLRMGEPYCSVPTKVGNPPPSKSGKMHQCLARATFPLWAQSLRGRGDLRLSRCVWGLTVMQGATSQSRITELASFILCVYSNVEIKPGCWFSKLCWRHIIRWSVTVSNNDCHFMVLGRCRFLFWLLLGLKWAKSWSEL